MDYKESRCIHFLYYTAPGRMLLKKLVRPGISRTAYSYLSSGFSKWLIPYYIRKYKIDMHSYPEIKYSSFNDFFIRKRKEQPSNPADDILIAPCDGFLSVYEITQQLCFQVKHVEYNIEALLDDRELAEKYRGGYCMVFRLAPHNYHRYLFADSGRIIMTKRINGELHCVRPEVYGELPVYIRNSREYTVIKSDNFGEMIQMEIGAMLVGRINNLFSTGYVNKCTEKGYFEFGGSTIVLLFRKNAVMPYEGIIRQTAKNKEFTVTAGDTIGSSIL